jgi:cytidyltransferase-like protein
VRLPEAELEEYTVLRMTKQVDIRDEPEPSGVCEAADLAGRYGTDPARRDLRLALVAGTFDVIHLGHLCLMEQARAMADRLVVAMQSTRSIRQQPKNHHGDLPIYGEADRIAVVTALACVDHVVLLDDLDCRRTLALLRPNCYVKHQRDRDRPIVQQEAAVVEQAGGQTFYINHPDWGYASGDIIRCVRDRSRAGPQ